MTIITTDANGLKQAKTEVGDSYNVFTGQKLDAGITPGVTSYSAPAGYKTPGAGIVSSSAPVVTQDNQTKTDVGNLLGTTNVSNPDSQKSDNTALINSSTAIQTQIQSQIDMLEQRRKDEVAGINAAFDVAGTDLKGKQANETGSTTAGIARMGGYLGGSGSGTGVMLNLAKSHQSEVTALEAKRQTAIQEANNAITDKQFDLARQKVKESKDLEQQIYDRNKDFWDQQLKLNQENRSQNTYLQTQAKNLLDVVSTTGVADTNVTKQIDSLYGTGTTAKYVEIVNADKQAKSTKAQYDNFKSKLDLMESLPVGVQMKFGDETITGIGKTSDIESFHVEDASGNVTLVTHNKATGTVSTQNLGVIGTPSNSAGGTTPGKISSMTSELSKLADPNTGYVTPTNYKNGLKVWLGAGGTLSTYEGNFKIFADPLKAKEYDFSAYYNKSSDELMKAFIENLK